jgi:phosphatidylserine/phosphatidylglycerophosphate/cardiolipin synthase-like enzyme/uncharacterized membrane protein YdjX (TVP38/TMEM64 family)
VTPTPAWLTHTEWTAHADRLAPLVDGVEYYRALRESLIRARRQVLIVGWDIHSEIDLLRGEAADAARDQDGYPVRLADLLERLIDEQPELRIDLLIWESSPLFTFERQQIPRMKRPWASRERMNLVWDRDTPPLGSQHQKIVVVDDRVAFLGGMDLTQARWDDHPHEPEDSRRRKPGLLPSFGNPYHDIMLAVDGEAACVLGDWCRERWRRATHAELRAPDQGHAAAPDVWPPSVEPWLRDRSVALALTLPARDDPPAGDPLEGEPEGDPGEKDEKKEGAGTASGGRGRALGASKGRERKEKEEVGSEKRQIEELYLAQIRCARRFIFIENQYFSCEAICDALCERLREDGGPEVVLILPYGCEGRLQAMALDTRRDVLLDRMREADGEQRLGVYWPTLRGGVYEDARQDAVYVHAKTMVVDDTLLRIGSANLANRSMGLDSELDACVWVDEKIEADAVGNADRVGAEEREREARDAIARYRQRLMAYLLHVSPQEVARVEEREGASPLAAIEALREGKRTLHPFRHRASTFQDLSLPIELADPRRPLSAEDVLRATEIAESAKNLGDKLETARSVAIGKSRRSVRTIVVLGLIGALAAVWAFTPLREQIDTEAVQSSLASLRASPLGNAAAVLAFWIVAALGFPVTLLIATFATVFGAFTSIVIAGLGVAGSASIGFALGRLLPGDARETLFAGRLRPIADRVRNRGVLTLAVLRNVPVAPYALVNVACGLTPIRYGSFIAGTLLGMSPGIVVASIFGQELAAWLHEPTLAGMLRLTFAAMLLVGVAVAMDRLLGKRARAEGEDEDEDEGTGRPDDSSGYMAE